MAAIGFFYPELQGMVLVMGHELDTWVTNLATELIPEDAWIAPQMLEAYLAGGKQRSQLFDSTHELGGLGGGAKGSLIPIILGAIAAAGGLWLGIMQQNTLGLVSNFLACVKHSLDLAQVGKSTIANRPAEFAKFWDLADMITSTLIKEGLEPVRAEVMGMRVLRRMCEEPQATGAFIKKIAEKP